MKQRQPTTRPWRVWVVSDTAAWPVSTLSFGSEAAAVKAARRNYPSARTIAGHRIAVGHIEQYVLKNLEDYKDGTEDQSGTAR